MSNNSQAAPTFVIKDSVADHDKMELPNCFKEYFISSGSLFDSACSASVKPCTEVSMYTGQSFSFVPFSVHKALKALDPRKPSRPDFIDPYFLNLATDFVAEPPAHFFR